MSNIHENAQPQSGFSLGGKLALLVGGLGLLMTAAFTILSTVQMREEATANYHHTLEAIVRVRESLLVHQYSHVDEILMLIAQAQTAHPQPSEHGNSSCTGASPKASAALGNRPPGIFTADQDVVSTFVEAEGRGTQQIHRLLEGNPGELPLGARLVFLDKRSVVLAPAVLREWEFPVSIPAGHLAEASISRRVHAWHGEQGSYLYRVFYFAPQEWYVACFIPLSSLEEVLARRMRQVLGMGLMLTLLGMVLAYLLGHRFASPLRALDRAARALPTLPMRGDIFQENGEENTAAPLRGVCSVGPPVLPPAPRILAARGDEVKALVRSFDCMVQQLQTNVRSTLALRQTLARAQSELQWARSIQDGLLPREFAHHAALDVHGCVLPAREMGGDFYDVFMLDDRHCCFTVGNVRDKGVPAAVTMSMILGLTRSLVRQCQPSSLSASSGSARDCSCVAAVLMQVNAALCRDNSRLMFASMILGVFDCTTGVMTWANAGHPSPLLFCPASAPVDAPEDNAAENATGKGATATLAKKIHNKSTCVRVDVLPTRQEPVAGSCEEAEYSTLTCTLNPGDRVMLYSDGTTGALREDGARFGTPPQYLEGLPISASAVNWRIVKKIQTFVAGAPQADDITLLNFLWRGPQE